jgi:hypothetical protein
MRSLPLSIALSLLTVAALSACDPTARCQKEFSEPSEASACVHGAGVVANRIGDLEHTDLNRALPDSAVSRESCRTQCQERYDVSRLPVDGSIERFEQVKATLNRFHACNLSCQARLEYERQTRAAELTNMRYAK